MGTRFQDWGPARSPLARLCGRGFLEPIRNNVPPWRTPSPRVLTESPKEGEMKPNNGSRKFCFSEGAFYVYQASRSQSSHSVCLVSRLALLAGAPQIDSPARQLRLREVQEAARDG